MALSSSLRKGRVASTMKVSRKDVVAAEERGIFAEFARSAGLDVTGSSISQPDPPDILCEVHGLGKVAFELAG